MTVSYKSVRGLVHCCFICLASGCHAATYDPQCLTVRCTLACNGHIEAAARLEAKYGGVVGDHSTSARLNRIGQELVRTVPELPSRCRFELLDCKQKNAFSLPGGVVYVTRGLYEHLVTDDLLAATVAHELAHLASLDGLEHCRSAKAKLQREISADSRAVRYLRAACVDPAALVAVLGIVSSEHDPKWAEVRISHLQSLLQEGEDQTQARIR